MRKLIEGIVAFREARLPELEQRFAELATSQDPETLFISCSDSRVVPNLLLSSEPGDLFVLRNVGNLMPPATADGVSTGDLSEASAIEYAVLVLEVETIVICGHSACGAMAAVLSGKSLPTAPNLGKWLAHADRALARLKAEGPLDPTLAPADQLSQWNVLVQLEHVLSYPVVREAVAAGRLALAGCWFDVGRGTMHAYDVRRRTFVAIDRLIGDEFLTRLANRATQGGTFF